jgi:serine/threonine-protein kinase
MALTPGTRVGPYEIVGVLGVGGMGEVYRATDTNLKRAVALKVLPESVATDRDRLARFQREAEVLASLNHPNIAAIHGVEESNGTRALVMELVDGPTLADRIGKGPIPLDETLSIAKQIAEALEVAHELGIIHRDLKPANIKLRPDGVVKVLDFGLAKAVATPKDPNLDSDWTRRHPPYGLSAAPTVTSPAMMTGAGVLLGTAAYMSPEQARGRTVDRRSDIWAFGCVLYEMLTGKRAFEDEDISLTLSNVLRVEPRLDVLPVETPAAVRQTLRLCLQKDPRDRLQAIGDVRLALSNAFGSTSSSQPVAAPASRLKARTVTVAAFFAGAVLAVLATQLTAPEPRLPSLVRTEIVASGDAMLNIQGADRDLVITPDGSRIVYRAVGGLFVRALGELEPTALIGTEARSIFVSPDGQWVGFFGPGSINKVSIAGGPPVTISSLTQAVNAPRGATWGSDGTIVYATSAPATGLLRVSEESGNTTVLTTPDRARGEEDHIWPEFMPGGRAVLFTILPPTGDLNSALIAVLDLQTNTKTVLVQGGHHAHYIGTGHLVYASGGTLRAIRFDPVSLTTLGTPVPIDDRVLTSVSGAANMAFAANGTLAYIRGSRELRLRRLVWVNRDGTSEPVGALEPDEYSNVRLSPDGRRAVVSLRNDLWVYELASGRRTRLTRDASVDAPMAWNPDGLTIAYTAARGGSENVWIQPIDNSSEPRQLTNLDGGVDVDSWSPDGRVLAVHHHRLDGNVSMLMIRADADHSPSEVFVEDEPWAEGSWFSPDGRYVAYMSRETGGYEVYVRAYPRAGGRLPVSVGGAREAIWSSNGELFYRSETGDRMLTVTMTTTPSLHIGAPKELFSGRFAMNAGTGPRPIYDVTRDGRRFLMLQDAPDASQVAPSPRLIVVQNWFAELTRLLPTD